MSKAVIRGKTDEHKLSSDANPVKDKKMIDLKGCETPRRALGDLKNVFATPVSAAIKRKATEKPQPSFDVYEETNSSDEKIISDPTMEQAEPEEDDDDSVIEKFNFEEHTETYEELFPNPEQRIDVADLFHKVQNDDRFLRMLFSDVLDGKERKLLDAKNPQTNEDCEKALNEILGKEVSD